MASIEGMRLYKIYMEDLGKSAAGKRCPCEFHQGNWSTQNAMTWKGVKLTGNGCLALSGLAAWLPDASAPAIGVIRAPLAKTGYNCARCNFKNDFAAANQTDGTYLCFECR